MRTSDSLKTRLLALILTCAAALWTAMVLLVPLQAPDGKASILAAAVYGTGARICHQRPDRSFYARGTRLPVCARCTGLYVAGAAGALAGWLGLTGLPRRRRALLLAAAVPTIVTVAAEWTGLASPSNAVRAVAGLPLGAVAGWLFVRLLRAESTPSTCAIIS